MIDVKTLNDAILSEFGKNRVISESYNKLIKGFATFEDASVFAGELGKICQKVYGSALTPEDLDVFVLNYTERLLRANASITHEFCDLVGANLNELGDLGLQPITPPIDGERLGGLIENASEITELGEIESLLGANMVDFIQSLVDEYVRQNADLQKSMGLKPFVVRKWVGYYGTHDTRRTDYCHELAGTYTYGEQPSKFFQRHRGCRCTVEYFPNKKSQGRITALRKGEVDVNNVLWNTSPTTLKSRQRKAVAKANAEKILKALTEN